MNFNKDKFKIVSGSEIESIRYFLDDEDTNYICKMISYDIINLTFKYNVVAIINDNKITLRRNPNIYRDFFGFNGRFEVLTEDACTYLDKLLIFG